MKCKNKGKDTKMNMRFETQVLNDPLCESAGITLSVARLDLIHPVVSGNKLFKLHYFIQQAFNSETKHIITFGGAYSNHLVATAFAARENGLSSTGIVRGEQPEQESHTLSACRSYGMKLKFVSRSEYSVMQEEKALENLQIETGAIVVPEGGYHSAGAKGASLIMEQVDKRVNFICVPAGTATTSAGILLGASPHQMVCVFPVIKGMNDLSSRIAFLTGGAPLTAPVIFPEYHEGGYAKYTQELLRFMNSFYAAHGIPLDFVYTGKMMSGVFKEIKKGTFPVDTHILCLHTGGLQGNVSVADQLIF